MSYSTNKSKISEKKKSLTKPNDDISLRERNQDNLAILLGGVIQTITIGTLGFLLLFFSNEKSLVKFKLKQWIFVFMAFFWSREVFNLFTGVFIGFTTNRKDYFYGDEAKIATLLNLQEGTLLLPLGIIGFGILFLTIKAIPNRLRHTFVLAVMVGSAIGYLLWMKLLGPLVLP